MTASENENLSLEIKKIIIDSSNLQNTLAEDIDEKQSLFKGGLGLDSIDMLEIAVNIERKFGFKIQNNDQGRQAFENVEALTNLVKQHIINSTKN